MADRDPEDMELVSAGQLATELAESTEIAAAVAAKWRDHLPEPWFVPPLWHPVCGLLLMMRRVKRVDLPGLRTVGSPEMQRYVEALRTIRDLAPGLHKSLAVELAEATPHVVRPGLEDSNADAMQVTLHYLAGAANYACEALGICEAVVRHGDLRRHWHYFGLRIGPIVWRHFAPMPSGAACRSPPPNSTGPRGTWCGCGSSAIDESAKLRGEDKEAISAVLSGP